MQINASSSRIHFLILYMNSVVTIGLNPASYSVAEDAGNISVTVSVLNGTLERGVSVILVTSVDDGTATGGILCVCSILLKCNALKPFLITLYSYSRL